MGVTGKQLRLAAGAYTAVVTEVGASLRTLTFGERPLTLGYGEDERMLHHRGAVLAPWPNRVADGAYTFASVSHQLAISEPKRHTALHGLVCFTAWIVEAQTEHSVSLRTRVWPQPGYDFMLDVRISYALGDDGLSIGLTATNVGPTSAPYGGSIHPYLLGGDGKVDAWRMKVPAERFVEVDPVRLLPTGATSLVRGTPLDFREPRLIGATEIDHAYADIMTGADKRTASARVVGADGRGAEIVWEALQCPWLQVHTADLPSATETRRGVALEPMTCPPDAFRSGVGLIVLAPGAHHHVSWRIRAVEPTADEVGA